MPGLYSLDMFQDKTKKGLRKSNFGVLVKEIIHNKATFVIFSGEKTKIFEKTPPLTVCHSGKELFNILMTKGRPYVIFIPKNSTQLKK